MIETERDAVAVRKEALVDRTRHLASAHFASLCLPEDRLLPGDAAALRQSLVDQAAPACLRAAGLLIAARPEDSPADAGAGPSSSTRKFDPLKYQDGLNAFRAEVRAWLKATLPSG